MYGVANYFGLPIPLGSNLIPMAFPSRIGVSPFEATPLPWGCGVDVSKRVGALLLTAEAATWIAAVANNHARGHGGRDDTLVFATRLLRPVRNLQALVWLSAQAAAGESRAHIMLTAAADELIRAEHHCRSASLAESGVRPGGTEIATAAPLHAPTLVAAAWHVTYLFADAPQRRQALLDALIREAVATYPLALLTTTAPHPTPTRAMMLAPGDLGFDPGDWEPGPLDHDLDLDPFDSDAILDLIGSRHRPPRLVWTDTGYVVDHPGSTIDFDRVYPALRCVEEAARLLQLHANPPPPQLTPATWFTGITRLELEGPCAGDTLSIHGSGFGATQPPSVVLLLPRVDGWAPVSVPAGDWSDTLIRVVLPNDIISGPIGFGDAGYLAVYNAWVDQMNAVADELAQLPCAPDVQLPKLPRWLSPPTGPVNILTAGEAHIRMFTANGGIDYAPTLRQNVLTPGTPLRLDWKVINASMLRVRRTSADGPPVFVTDPMQTFADLGTVDHDEPSQFTYRLTARGPCGTRKQATISVYASQRPQLSIARISVEQGWSQPDGIRLVAGKPALVRVRVRHGLKGWGTNSVPWVTGTLVVSNKGTGTTDVIHPAVSSMAYAPMYEKVGASITVRPYPKWTNVDHTLNFVMPGNLTTDVERTAAVYVSVSNYGGIGGFAGFGQKLAAAVPLPTFHPRRPLDIRYVPVKWGVTNAPSDADCVDVIERALTLLPTPWANIAPLWPGQHWEKTSGLNDADAFRDLLDDFVDMYHGSALWVLVVPKGAGPGKIVGEADGIPSNVLVTEPRATAVAHELAHCLNQSHIRLCGAKGGDSPEGAWHGGNRAGVVVDLGSSVTLTNPLDLMTYCDGRWPVPKRWNRLFKWIGP